MSPLITITRSITAILVASLLFTYSKANPISPISNSISTCNPSYEEPQRLCLNQDPSSFKLSLEEEDISVPNPSRDNGLSCIGCFDIYDESYNIFGTYGVPDGAATYMIDGDTLVGVPLVVNYDEPPNDNLRAIDAKPGPIDWQDACLLQYI
ncbi:hypothetical protein F4821DRAFT_259047 [Hypoxylon rubiginosum]|uniref:Uncharacterized protein n=1 Tax=Hypoxylon rubiginosum TaxID=110542 RepID=A0ACC0D3S4_9PEZI|nr:hypothetical protein F4821DRAFT_259047 [Hypoxylon rubiginosum]